jgi:hypothetical protein
MPWILGCGGCGLLIVLAFVAFFVIAQIGKRRGQAAHAGADTTIVTGDTTGGAVKSPSSAESDTTAASSDGVSDQHAKPSEPSTTGDQSQQQDDTLPQIKRIEPLHP